MAQTLPYQNVNNSVSWIEPRSSAPTTSAAKVSASSGSGHTLNITVDPMQTISDAAPVTASTAASIFVELSPPSSKTKSSKVSTDSPLISSSKLDDLNRSSFHSSVGLRSPDTDLKWTSFNDDSEAEETPGSRRHSESERKNLLDDDPLLSDGDDSQASNFDPNDEWSDDKSFEISPELRSYYIDKYKKLLIQQTYSGTDGATPTALVDLRSSALKGTSPAVQEFFRKSQLNQSELSKIWYLADVNMDGYLNLDEFLVAMHLIVRRVKGNYNIPSQLPVEFRPPVTPPRNVTPKHSASMVPADDGPTSARQWAEFADTPQPPKAPSPNNSVGAGPVSSDPLSPHVLAKFTSIPPSDQNSKMAYPKARRGSPDYGSGRPVTGNGGTKSPFGSVSVSSTPFTNAAPIPPLPRPRPSTSSDTKVKSPPPVAPSKVLSPLTPNPPKGPPPKPPPRPPRHTRSVSLDLNKNRLSELTSPPLASTLPPAPSVEVNLNPFLDLPTPTRRDAQVQTVVQYPSTVTDPPMLDLSLDLNRTLTVTSASLDGPSSTVNGAKSMTSSSVTDPGEDHSKDWKKRCARLNRVNGDLERELRKLQQTRTDLETDLKRMQKF